MAPAAGQGEVSMCFYWTLIFFVIIKSHALLKSSSSIINNDKLITPEACVDAWDLSYVSHLIYEIILDRY